MPTADFTIRDVLAWARTKPADERYCFIEAADCALGQFAREVRGFSEDDAGCQLYMPLVPEELFEAAQGDGRSIAQLEAQQTFGALVKRLEAILPAVSDTWTKADAYLTDIEDVARERCSA